MKVSKMILEKILTDNDFSLGLAGVFGIKQISLEMLARRNSGKLTQYAAIEFYKKNGFTEEEIFETETEKA